jgi:hypothetical protein
MKSAVRHRTMTNSVCWPELTNCDDYFRVDTRSRLTILNMDKCSRLVGGRFNSTIAC